MVINKKKNENKIGTHRPYISKKKMFTTIQYLFDWTHMRHPSLPHGIISLSQLYKERGEVQGTKTI